MWVLKQCMDAWSAQGRPWKIEDIVKQAGEENESTGFLDMDAETLMLDTEMPQRINKELTRLGFDAIADVAGNEPRFARVIFESLSIRYAAALASLEKMLGRKLTAIHMLGGANRNKLLVRLTEERTGLPVEIGERGGWGGNQARGGEGVGAGTLLAVGKAARFAFLKPRGSRCYCPARR
jgi:rhamnulokinase